MVLRDGVLLGQHAGVLSGAAIDEMIRRVQELDMDDIRQKIDAASSEMTTNEERV